MPNLVGIGNSQVPTNAMLGKLAYQDSVDEKIIEKINARTSDTAVDVFVYDTRKDSDGGAWRKKTTTQSWYNEGVSERRGARKEFPIVAVIVCLSNHIKIYDGDDPNLSLWMDVRGTSSARDKGWMYGSDTNAVVALNGIIGIAANWNIGDEGGLLIIDLIKDELRRHDTSGGRTGGGLLVSQRGTAVNLNVDPTTNNVELVGGFLYDVAMTVLPNAPIDEFTGLPRPTIAVATDQGISIVRDGNFAIDMKQTYSGDKEAKEIYFTKSNKIAFTHGSDWVYYYPIPSSDISATYWNGLSNFIGRFTDTRRDWVTNGIPINVGSNGITNFLEDRAIGHTNGLDLIDINTGINGRTMGFGMHCGIATNFNTGWQHADIRLATLSSTDTTNVTGELIDLTNGSIPAGNSANVSNITASSVTFNSQGSAVGRYNTGTHGGHLVSGKQYLATMTISNYSGSSDLGVASGAGFDGSFRFSANGTYHKFINYTSGEVQLFYRNSNTATVALSLKEVDIDHSDHPTGVAYVGTVQRSVVADGAELVSYNSLSSSNYLEQPYNSNLDFGTDDFCMMGWFYNLGTSSSILYRLHNSTTVGIGYIVALSSGGELGYSSYTQGFRSLGRITHYSNDTWNGQQQWNMFVCGKRNGVGYTYVNGILKASGANNQSHTDTTYKPPLRIGNNHAASGGLGGGKLALIRISSGFPSEEQIEKIFNDEKKLFNKNAKCTLHGITDSVVSLAYDDTDNTIHAGTSSGRSQFSGLTRINNTTKAVATAISVSNGLVAEQ